MDPADSFFSDPSRISLLQSPQPSIPMITPKLIPEGRCQFPNTNSTTSRFVERISSIKCYWTFAGHVWLQPSHLQAFKSSQKRDAQPKWETVARSTTLDKDYGLSSYPYSSDGNSTARTDDGFKKLFWRRFQERQRHPTCRHWRLFREEIKISQSNPSKAALCSVIL
jgi:hypothetical protein